MTNDSMYVVTRPIIEGPTPLCRMWGQWGSIFATVIYFFGEYLSPHLSLRGVLKSCPSHLWGWGYFSPFIYLVGSRSICPSHLSFGASSCHMLYAHAPQSDLQYLLDSRRSSQCSVVVIDGSWSNESHPDQLTYLFMITTIRL